jgi:hypothetical protein
MNVLTLIQKLQAYADQSPENGMAEVLIQNTDELCFQIESAQDLRGMPNEHFLALVPWQKGPRIGIRKMKAQ